ncbi:terminase (plasmid) [Photobacterium sp. CCB-ST2H9]|uniref:terminase n=1 Tax=Photobacterium sp. CCB-ST2H9 TaxID=2912855 RepID=UPI0020066900|nr:terminase [Photobacterium sp. CCB-ST2H9]UTM60455.1 terminase [Photobacterium sp. CCB-ST2H9]
MARKLKRITSDPRYWELVKKYRYDWIGFAVELVGKTPTWQQEEIIIPTQETGSRVSVASGHGTGKSDMTSIMILAYMILYPDANVVIVANKIAQVQQVIWKYLNINWKQLCKNVPWIEQYFTLTDTQFYATASKKTWFATPRGCRVGNEESLAGSHAKHLFYIVDEASGVSDAAFGVMTGALTEKDNRMLLLSQPTKNSGYFYDTHNKLAYPRGRWVSIKLNSEESPLVTLQFILDKRLEYGGREAAEYLIKVRGEFPKTISGYLLGRDELDKAVHYRPILDDDWGWIACVDVGNGRDKSVLNIMKVSGHRVNRKLVTHRISEMEGTVDPVRFADIIFAECSDERYPNITIVVDSDGQGYDTATLLERKKMRVQRIHWGKRMHSTKDRERFFNQRAYAHIAFRDGIRSRRIRIDSNVKTAEQGSKLPCTINEAGQNVMMPKPIMKQKYNIKSPDRTDTYCFGMLANYTPANVVITNDMVDERNNAENWVNEGLAA